MIKSFFNRHWSALLAFGMIIYMLISIFSHPKPTLTAPDIKPNSTPYSDTIAGIGVVEPQSENIEIGTTKSGIVTQVYVKIGQKVSKNSPLFTIDTRDAMSRLEAAKAKLALAMEQFNESKHQLQFYNNVDDKRAISAEEMTRRVDNVKINEARVRQAQADLGIVETEIGELTVKSPIDATVLKLSIHTGEYAQAGELTNPFMILGNIDVMHVRVEVDETNGLGILPNAKAVGYLRNSSSQAVPLKFVRIEPLVSTKKIISNQSNELIDTRVFVIIYSFDNTQVNAYIGQQMDVFINAKDSNKSK